LIINDEKKKNIADRVPTFYSLAAKGTSSWASAGTGMTRKLVSKGEREWWEKRL
jgi:hypothetical protein